ncbi:MAG TPA: hypothetical protein VGT98_15095 [Candidatus Elarobacter sp.]|nr:hypothetical protein [Candidatus Elarobacter sp.]HEV2738162.1 hypothetical protein [Candidatus Elarobacter sp.]
MPFQLDRSHIGIVPGTTEKTHAYGVAHRPIRVVSTFPGVSANYDATSRTLSLTGVARGTGTVSLIDANGATATTAVLVAPPAGTVPADVNVELAGNVTPFFLATRVRDAIAQRATLQPFVDVRIPSVPVSLQPGHTVQAATIPVQVTLDGRGAFVNVTSKATVHLQIDGLPPPLAPQTLLYSDSPEYVTADGVLFRSVTPAAPGRPARIYLYHVAMSEPRGFALVLRARDTTAHVALTGASAPPSSKYLCTGHRATAEYLREVRRRESVVATVAPDRPFVLPLQSDMHVRDLIAAAYDVTVLDGGAVDVEVVSTAHGIDPLSVAGDPEAPADRSRRKGEFALGTIRPISLDVRIGSPDEEPSIDIGLGSVEGTPEFPNLRPGPRFFPGDYGIVRPVRLHLVNATDTPQTAYLYEVALNRALTSTFWFDGDLNPTEVPMVTDPNQRYVVRAFPLAPNEDRTVTGEYMTDGGSNYTAEYGLTADQPQTPPPWNCP